MTLPRPVLAWARTFAAPDAAGQRSKDWTARDPAHRAMFARIYLPASGQGGWAWYVGERANVGSGVAPTAREAALAAEAAWFAYREREYGTPAPTE